MNSIQNFCNHRDPRVDRASHRMLLDLRRSWGPLTLPLLGLFLATALLSTPGWAQCTITTTSLPTAVLSQPYSATVYTSNCTGNLTWATLGSLPPGLQVTSGPQET